MVLALAANQDFCGNNIRDASEICDPTVQVKGCSTECEALPGWTCMDFSFLGDGYEYQCMFRCGDGVVAVGGEVCDGQIGCNACKEQ